MNSALVTGVTRGISLDRLTLVDLGCLSEALQDTR